MLETVLNNYSVLEAKKVTYKTLVSVGLIVLAVALPQLVHLALGQPGGVKWLPMYLPILIGGCLMGTTWGAMIGLLSPLVSFALTSLMGSPMPAAARLPFMMAELLVFAVVSGLFTKRIAQNGLWAFVAVVCAQIVGRATFLGLVAIFNRMVEFTPMMIWGQIKTGFIGLGVQAVIVPIAIILFRALAFKGHTND